MMVAGRPAKILLIDSNVYFSKRLGDALRKEGFEVISANQAAFALTTLEYDQPVAILCATNMREMNALEIASIVHADPKNAALPIIAIGDGSQRALPLLALVARGAEPAAVRFGIGGSTRLANQLVERRCIAQGDDMDLIRVRVQYKCDVGERIGVCGVQPVDHAALIQNIRNQYRLRG